MSKKISILVLILVIIFVEAYFIFNSGGGDVVQRIFNSVSLNNKTNLTPLFVINGAIKSIDGNECTMLLPDQKTILSFTTSEQTKITTDSKEKKISVGTKVLIYSLSAPSSKQKFSVQKIEILK